MPITCPSCQFIREDDQHLDVPEWKCPNCDIVYEKFIKNYSDGSIPISPSTLKPVDPTPNPESPAEPKAKHFDAKASAKQATYKPEPTQSKVHQFIERYDLGNFVTAKGGLIMLLVFIVGFFAGREYFKYELRQAVGSAFAGIGERFKPNKSESAISKLFAKSNTLPVSLVRIDYEEVKSIIGGLLKFTINFKNTFDKKIIGFNGNLTFSDILDNKIESFRVTFTEGVNVGEIIEFTDEKWVDSSLKSFKGGRIDQLKVKLTLTKVMFADGTVEEFD